MSDGHLHDVCCVHENATLCRRDTCQVTRPCASFQMPLFTAFCDSLGVYANTLGSSCVVSMNMPAT